MTRRVLCVNVVLITITLFSICYSSFSDVTGDVFDTSPKGIIAAFGDFDADKTTDVFIILNDGKSVDILEADIDIRRDGTEFAQKHLIKGSTEDDFISSIVPGDFNSDAQMDILITRLSGKDKGSTQVAVEIYKGEHDAVHLYLKLNETLRDQPAVIDANGDMIPDLFGETEDGKRAVWMFGKENTYSLTFMKNGSSNTLPPLRVPQSSAFLDLNGDLTADLCAVSVNDGVVTFEFWFNQEGNLTWTRNVYAPPELIVVGQASFGDLNGNHEINIILPGCLDAQCKESAIYVWAMNKYSREGDNGRWHKLDVNFHSDHHDTSFPESTSPLKWLNLPIALRIGDFNLDGYPDALAILSDSMNEKANYSLYILYNEGCGSKCDGFSRTFSINYGHHLQKQTPTLASFFDLMENGVLDVLVTEVDETGTASVRAIKQDFSADASFLKVLVVSGLCNDNCPHGHSPYGVNQVGPVAKFESTTPTGGDQIGVASQLSQSAYFSLQLPFMLFGLGQTPNFVDDLEVGIPYPPGESPRHHSWSTIIPNSQVIVIPYPVDHPGHWKHELYVTPSRLVLLTGISLLGTCAFIAIIVGLLHWRERMEDKKEKLQESQRFHFDAM